MPVELATTPIPPIRHLLDESLDAYYQACRISSSSSTFSSDDDEDAELLSQNSTEVAHVPRVQCPVVCADPPRSLDGRPSDAEAARLWLSTSALTLPSPSSSSQLAESSTEAELTSWGFLLDALWALRQSPNPRFVWQVEEPTNTQRPLRCQWRPTSEQIKSLSPAVRGAVMQLLQRAGEVGTLQMHLRRFQEDVAAASAEVDLSSVWASALTDDYVQHRRCVEAEEALAATSFNALLRLALIIRNLLRDFDKWVLDVLEYLAAMGPRCCLGKPIGTTPKVGEKRCRAGTTPPPQHIALSDILHAVEESVEPLARFLVMVESTRCLQLLRRGGSSSSAKKVAKEEPLRFMMPESSAEFGGWCTHAATTLMDFLIIQASALQSAPTLDLYRCYMVVLLHCAWPYMQLATAAIFGFVTGIEEDVWRRQLPRLFRSSFAHVPVGGPRRYSTDVLSLVMECVGYEDGEGIGTQRRAALRVGSHHRRGGTSSEQAALSALQSSRLFLLRSFHTFAQRRRSTRGEKISTTTHTATTSAEEAVLPTQPQNQSIHDILHALMSQGHEDGSELSPLQVSSTTPLYTTQTTLCGVPDDGSNVACLRTFPTLLPLGFATMRASLPGQAAFRHARRSQGEVAAADEDDEERVGALWGLRISHHASRPDLGFINRWADVEEQFRVSLAAQPQHSNNNNNTSSTASLTAADGGRRGAAFERIFTHLLATAPAGRTLAEGQRQRRRTTPKEGELWMSTTIPAARWVSAALLVPLGVVVQRLQERRLRDLFRVQLPTRRELDRRATIGPNLPQALSLMHDIAFFRDGERMVDGFIARLLEEPRWWLRRRQLEEVGAVGTASSFISSAFADAVRGRAWGDAVRLIVRPPPPTTTEQASTPPEDADAATAALATFAAFELQWQFPAEIAMMVLPRQLSVESAGGRGGGDDGAQHARAIASDFWRRRRGEGRDGHLHSASVATGLMSFADVWSSVFGYLCCLHYCQRLLREQRKALHIQDTHEHALQATLGRPTPTAMRHVQAVSRGLGSSFFALSFVVDSFISFTLREVSIVMLQTEAFPRRIEELGSGVELCRALDQLLVELQGVCFRAEPPACEAPAQPSMASASVRTAINLVLALVLTDTRLPVALVHGRARNAIEALVAVISTLNGAEPLKRRLSPLLAMLTFNRYYGESDGGSYQFR